MLEFEGKYGRFSKISGISAKNLEKKLELVQIFIFSFHFSIRVLGAHRRGGPGLPLRCCGEEDDEGQEGGVAVRRGEGRLSCG